MNEVMVSSVSDTLDIVDEGNESGVVSFDDLNDQFEEESTNKKLESTVEEEALSLNRKHRGNDRMDVLFLRFLRLRSPRRW